jgi:hypothetical protein
MKDWIWNNKSAYTCIWASSHSEGEREINDYYATSPDTLYWLLQYIKPNNNIWECACWEWHLSKRLIELWYNVVSSDLIDRWHWTWWVDFLKCNKKWGWDILTNPPYSIAQEFVEHWLTLIEDWSKIIMFLKLTFLEWQKRYKLFKQWNLKYVLVFSRRQQCAKNWDFAKYESNAIAYAWYIWEKWYYWDTIIKWICTTNDST